MGKYKIRVKVELLECDGAKEHGAIKEDDGSFAMTITEQDAIGDIPLLLDAAQTAGCYPIDVEADGIDFFAFTGHKGLLGPQDA